MKVVGKDETTAKRKTCDNCGAILEYYPIDIKRVDGTDYGGGPDGCRYLECPECKHHVVLERW